MISRRLGCLLSLTVLLAAAVPVTASAQSAGQEQQQPKKKARKIWTNDDFPERPKPAPPQEKEQVKNAEPAPQPADKLLDELDQARAERDRWRDSLPVLRQGLDDLYERRRRAGTAYDRDMYDEAIEASEAELAETEETVKELEAQVVELEKLTKRKKRPAKPAPRSQPTEPSPPSPR